MASPQIRTFRFVVAAVIAAGAWLALQAQSAQRANAEFLRSAYDTYRAMERSSPYRLLSWSFLGPTNISGRSTANAVADRNGQRRIYAAYATSGVWKTDD